MSKDRVRCPGCNRNVPGVVRDDTVITVRIGQVTVQYMGTGSVTCPCGAKLTTVAGAVRYWATPNVKPRQADPQESDIIGGDGLCPATGV